MTATQILKVVCILLFPSILRSCVHAKKTRKRQNKAGVGERLRYVHEGAVLLTEAWVVVVCCEVLVLGELACLLAAIVACKRD